ncbi:hypothetical protein APHCRT_1298 [Anaplasma phagocytophilum str. CRT53-1]|uniref:Uncharacterized protein n=1 Tax=Anaplasma phagocytophilum str. CRT53-1 TaxID=1359157 RepID=A0A0F3PTZ7_ANAPH|nr:hypothetical protein APHCRT_1298 [Anaplasma phagocytophilum str. CRT53-1]
MKVRRVLSDACTRTKNLHSKKTYCQGPQQRLRGNLSIEDGGSC